MGISRRRFSSVMMSSLGLGVTGLLGACATRPPTPRFIPPGATVLALGDSITYGIGASLEQSYPVLLAKATGWNVINAGAPGITSGGTLQRVSRLLTKHRPSLVITCIGVNDFSLGVPEEEVRQNIIEIGEHVNQAWAQHVLIAAPYVHPPTYATVPIADAPLYAEIAQEMGVPLLEHILTRILSARRLRADLIHANAPGYRILASALTQFLHQQHLLAYDERWVRFFKG